MLTRMRTRLKVEVILDQTEQVRDFYLTFIRFSK